MVSGFQDFRVQGFRVEGSEFRVGNGPRRFRAEVCIVDWAPRSGWISQIQHDLLGTHQFSQALHISAGPMFPKSPTVNVEPQLTFEFPQLVWSQPERAPESHVARETNMFSSTLP